METELEILQLLEKVSGHVTSKTEAGEGQQDDDESLVITPTSGKTLGLTIVAAA